MTLIFNKMPLALAAIATAITMGVSSPVSAQSYSLGQIGPNTQFTDVTFSFQKGKKVRTRGHSVRSFSTRGSNRGASTRPPLDRFERIRNERLRQQRGANPRLRFQRNLQRPRY